MQKKEWYRVIRAQRSPKSIQKQERRALVRKYDSPLFHDVLGFSCTDAASFGRRALVTGYLISQYTGNELLGETAGNLCSVAESTAPQEKDLEHVKSRASSFFKRHPHFYFTEITQDNAPLSYLIPQAIVALTLRFVHQNHLIQDRVEVYCTNYSAKRHFDENLKSLFVESRLFDSVDDHVHSNRRYTDNIACLLAQEVESRLINVFSLSYQNNPESRLPYHHAFIDPRNFFQEITQGVSSHNHESDEHDRFLESLVG